MTRDEEFAKYMDKVLTTKKGKDMERAMRVAYERWPEKFAGIKNPNDEDEHGEA